MLTKSFIFLPGVGALTERRLWKEGVASWGDFISRDRAGPFSGERKHEMDQMLAEASEKLVKGDLAYFSDLLPGAEAWRMWSTFREGAVFLDIETTGTRRSSPITVVGVYDESKGYRIAMRGRNLSAENIGRLLSDASLLVTYNGASFDLPLIRHQFPGSLPKVPHLDLRPAAGRCGFSGGLKKLEMDLGIYRPSDVKGMSGEDAVRLWKLYEKDGNRNALKLLLKYNMEDIRNLKPITEKLVSMLEGSVTS